jgi:hypothetical protein
MVDLLLHRQMLTEDRIRRDYAARMTRRLSPATSYPDGRPFDRLIYQEEREERVRLNQAVLEEVTALLKRPYVADAHVRSLRQMADELTASRFKIGYPPAQWERYWEMRDFILAV